MLHSFENKARICLHARCALYCVLCMEISAVIERQLRYCERAADTEQEKQSVAWWLARVRELKEIEPAPVVLVEAKEGMES